MESTGNWEEGKGLIVMMDALGMRSEDLIKSRDNMRKIQAFKKKVRSYQSNFEKLVFKDISWQCVLGDMFAFVYPMMENAECDANVFERAAHRVSDIFHSALDVGIMMRGAIAFGEYLIDNDERTILGPGISDAMKWCEAADWLGIVLTEKTGKKYALSGEEMDRFIKYDVPISKKSASSGIDETKKLWALDWCRHFAKMDGQFQYSESESMPCLGRNYLLEKFPPVGSVSPAVYSKYYNTVSFYDFCMEDWELRFVTRSRK